MKTFKEWYQSLGDKAQEKVRSFGWVDMSTSDGYAKTELTEKNLDQYIKDNLAEIMSDHSSYYMDGTSKTLLSYIAIKEFLDRHPKYMSSDNKNELIRKFVNESSDIKPLLSREQRIACIEAKASYRDEKRYSLEELIYITDDFDTIDWSKLKDNTGLDDALVQMMDEEHILERLKVEPTLIRITKQDYDNDLFDKLFFGEDGWTEEQKRQVIRHHYSACSSDIEDFVGRIVSVDMSNLKYLPHIIRYGHDTSSLTAEFKRKKSEEDLTANGISSKSQSSYFYSKEVRTAFQILWCCKNERMAASRARAVGELASIIKLYNYDYQQIIDALYPSEEAQAVAA